MGEHLGLGHGGGSFPRVLHLGGAEDLTAGDAAAVGGDV